MPSYPTLIKPPPPSDNKAPIEDSLELTSLDDISPGLFTNTRPLWHPPGARGIYGGAAIAQCLAAAQKTVPNNFSVHSMHCYFVLNGNADIPVIYHVEAVRDGRSFCTRTVQARQRGKPIFTTTLSFMREGAGGEQKVEHAHPIMAGMVAPGEDGDIDVDRGPHSPFIQHRVGITNAASPHPHSKRSLQWIKARGRISEEGGYQAHLSALAYMSDSYFIGTVARAHALWRSSASAKKFRNKVTPGLVDRAKTLADETLMKEDGMDDEAIKQLRSIDFDAQGRAQFRDPRPEIGMMVSLDHSIYFHSPRNFRADEWLFTESETPWAGDGRGLVLQRMYTKEGLLVASCVQEGLVRLKQSESKL